MKIKFSAFLTALLFSITTANAQLGIRAGVNMANEIRSINNEAITTAFKSDNLTGYQIGLVYQMNIPKTGFGTEIGALLSQKGGTFRFDSTGVVNSLVKGYKEINYVEVPFNLRYRLNLGLAGVYGSAGIYGAYALNGQTVFESDIIGNLKQAENFDDFMSRIDYGYSFGAGVELIKKIQLGVSWSQGLQKKESDKSILEAIKDENGIPFPNLKATATTKVFSVKLTYLF